MFLRRALSRLSLSHQSTESLPDDSDPSGPPNDDGLPSGLKKGTRASSSTLSFESLRKGGLGSSGGSRRDSEENLGGGRNVVEDTKSIYPPIPSKPVDLMPGALPLDDNSSKPKEGINELPESSNGSSNAESKGDGLGPRRSFNPFLSGLAGFTISPTGPSTELAYPTPPNEDDTFMSSTRRQPPSAPTQDPYLTPGTPPLPTPSTQDGHTEDEQDEDRRKRRRRRAQNSSFAMLQSIVESNDSHSSPAPTSPSTSTSLSSSSNAVGSDVSISLRLEEAAKQARLKLANDLNNSNSNSTGPPTPLKPTRSLPDSLQDPDLATGSKQPVPETKDTLPLPKSSDDLKDEPPAPPEKDEPSPVLDTKEEPEALASAHCDFRARSFRELQERSVNNQEDKSLLEQKVPQVKLPSQQVTFPPPLQTSPSHSSSVDADVNEPTAPSSTSPVVDENPQKASPNVKELEQEVKLLRAQLNDSKVLVQSLSEEKLRIVQNSRKEKKDSEQASKTLTSHNKQLESENLQQAQRIKQLETELEQTRSKTVVLTRDNERLKQQSESDKQEMEDVLQQLKSQIEENKRVEKEIRDLQKLKQEASLALVRYKTISKEKAGWQSQIDAMQHRLSEGERRARCLDEMARHRFEAKQEGGFGSHTVGRSSKLHHSPHVKGPSTDVIGAVALFNEEVLQTANLLVENLERVGSQKSGFASLASGTKSKSLALTVWGQKVTVMLEEQAKDTKNPTKFNFLLMQNCLEVFITHWCVNIIEAWYPLQPSFADLLVELAAQTSSGSRLVGQQICGKQTQIIQTKSSLPAFGDWVDEIVQDLSSLLSVGGVKMRQMPSRPALFASKLLPLVKQAYNLRLALVEKDICGGLEVAAPAPDMPFETKFMEEAHALDRRMKKSSGTNWTDVNFIAGTSAFGLKRTLNGQPGVYEMVVKPKVVLVHVLEESG